MQLLLFHIITSQLLSADVGEAVGGGPVLPEDLVRVLQAHCMSHVVGFWRHQYKDLSRAPECVVLHFELAPVPDDAGALWACQYY